MEQAQKMLEQSGKNEAFAPSTIQQQFNTDYLHVCP